MNRVFRTTIFSAAVAATTLAMSFSADAGDRWRHHRHNNGDAVAAGVLGLAVGALAAGALSQPRYYEPDYTYVQPRRYARPAPVYVERYGAEPWSPAWYRYCENRYRSFDPRSGTFIGYDGMEHFCVAN